MALIVQKFGGSSVKDRDRIFNVARIVANTHNAGNDVVVVVSAQGDTTDDLIAKAAEITHNPSAREMVMLLAAGEEISIALLAMALNELGCHATSLTGWQAGFRTDRAYTKARITKLETERISSELERNRVVVVAGFQGLNKLDDITTLGRGGSDTSAVAIAAALHADRCQIFTDVEGVYTADPRKVRNTRKLDEITFDEMLELASLGAQVLNNRSVELAKKYNVELEVLSSLNPVPGTVVKEVVKDVEGMLIKGVAKDTDVAVITILNVPDEPGTSFKIFGLLAQKNINVDIILQSTGRDGKKDISFTCAESEAETAMRVLRESAKFDQVTCDETCAKVSIVGAGMQSHSGVASKMFEALSNNNINIKMISTSEIKISCIIDREDADKAVSAIHEMLFEYDVASKPLCRASCAGAAAFCVHNFFTAPAVYTQIKGVYNIIMCLYPGRTSKTGRKLHHGAKSTRTPPRAVAERTPPETPYPPRAQLDGLSAQLRRGHGCDDRRHPLAAAQGLCPHRTADGLRGPGV